jgi:hypothetical protein
MPDLLAKMKAVPIASASAESSRCKACRARTRQGRGVKPAKAEKPVKVEGQEAEAGCHKLMLLKVELAQLES